MGDRAILRQNQNNKMGNKDTAHHAEVQGSPVTMEEVCKMVASSPASEEEMKRKRWQQKAIFIK